MNPARFILSLKAGKARCFIQFDLSQDAQYWDQVQPLTLTSARETGPMVQTVAVAKQRPINKRELAASNGVYLSFDSIFLVPAVLLQQGNPKLRDTVVTSQEPGTTYTVIGVEGRCRDLSGNPQRWVLTARNPIIAYELQDTVTIERADDDYSGTSVIRRWPSGNPSGGSVLYKSLPCRVQPQQAATTEERGLGGQATSYLVYLGKQVAIPNVRECRLLWTPQGQTASQVLGRLVLKQSQMIDQLPYFEAVAEV